MTVSQACVIDPITSVTPLGQRSFALEKKNLFPKFPERGALANTLPIAQGKRDKILLFNNACFIVYVSDRSFVLLNLFIYYYSILTAMFIVKEFGMNLLIYLLSPR